MKGLDPCIRAVKAAGAAIAGHPMSGSGSTDPPAPPYWGFTMLEGYAIPNALVQVTSMDGAARSFNVIFRPRSRAGTAFRGAS